MSASREKKQRQSAGPDQKASKLQQEQAARKRQTIIYSAVGAVIAVLVIALLVWRTGFFQARASAATVGGETLSAAELGYYYNSVRSTYVTYGLVNSSTPDSEQAYLNTEEYATYRDYFMATALTSAQQHIALAQEAVNAGHTEAEIKADLDAQIDSAKSYANSNALSYSAYLKALYGEYMTPSIFEKVTTRYLMANLVATDKYNELYDGYAQSDLDAYYQENADSLDTLEYSYLYFAIPTVNTKDDEGNELSEDETAKLKEEAQANAKSNAEEALAAVEGGASFESQADKYDLTSHGDHVKAVGTGSINPNYSEQLLALDKDECTLVENDNGYYVVSFHDRYLNDEATRDVRHILALAENTTDDDGKLVAPTQEAWDAAKAKMDEIQASWDAGDKTEDAFASLANEKSDDSDGTDGGLYERSANGGFVPEFNDWVFDSSRQAGDVGMVQHSADEGATSGYYGYHLIYYVGENEPVWMGTVRDTLAKEAQTEWIESLTEAFPTTELGGAANFGK